MLPLILGAVARIAGSAILRGAAGTAARTVAGGAARSAVGEAAGGAAARSTGSRVLQGMQFGSSFARGVSDGSAGRPAGSGNPAPLDPPQRSF